MRGHLNHPAPRMAGIRLLRAAMTAPLLAAWIASVSVAANAGDKTPEAYQPRGQRRVIWYYDPQALWAPTLPEDGAPNPWIEDPEGWKRVLETVVHAHAEAQVDTIVHAIFSRFSTNMRPGVSTLAQPIYEQVSWTHPLKPMHDAGHDMVQIVLDQAHRDGLTFIGGMRMNDRHGGAYQTNVTKGFEHQARMYHAHPEWHLRGAPGGFDYSHQGVRDLMLQFVDEALHGYDFDGIEFDWMRWIFIFPQGTEPENAPLLTRFHRRARELLNKHGAARGRRLLLGARVPDSLAECTAYGYDVATWIKEGLVDYIVPSGFGHMDANAPISAFRRLTEDTPCRVYPAIHPWTGPCRFGRSGFWKPRHHFAVAHNYYGFGADGIATYNIQPRTLKERLPLLFDLAPLADPHRLARQERDYMFWRRPAGRRHPKNPGESVHFDAMTLAREVGIHGFESRGTFTMRLAEHPAHGDRDFILEFKAVGLRGDDVIRVALNGRDIPENDVERFHVWDGRNFQDEHEPYDLVRFRPDPTILQWGGNELAVALRSRAHKGHVHIEEVNVKVRPTGGAP